MTFFYILCYPWLTEIEIVSFSTIDCICHIFLVLWVYIM